MTLNRIKLGRAVTFMKYLASAVSLMFPLFFFFSAIAFTESCRTGDK